MYRKEYFESYLTNLQKAYKQKNLHKGDNKKMASYLHRTATTAYLCCVPTLEEFAGAGRVGLATANILPFYIFPSFLNYSH